MTDTRYEIDTTEVRGPTPESIAEQLERIAAALRDGVPGQLHGAATVWKLVDTEPDLNAGLPPSQKMLAEAVREAFDEGVTHQGFIDNVGLNETTIAVQRWAYLSIPDGPGRCAAWDGLILGDDEHAPCVNCRSSRTGSST